MKTSSQGRKFIESFEGLILGAYDDHNDHVVVEGQAVVGTLTIGYGHTDAAGPPRVYVGQRITQNEADTFLANDLASVEAEVNHLVKVPLNQDQYDALVSFQFNTGALGKSSLLKVLNEKNYDAAADDFLAWDHAGGVKLAGLTRRREAERKMFLASQTTNPIGVHTATTIVVAGTAAATAAATAPTHTPLIFLGVIAAAFIVGMIVHWYNNRKVTSNVVSVQPVDWGKSPVVQV